jgi:hypothetical protein
MSRALDALRVFEQSSLPVPDEPLNSDNIMAALNVKLDQFGFTGIVCSDVDVDTEGNISVDFSDTAGGVVTAIFVADGARAEVVIVNDDGNEFVTIDLDTIAPTFTQNMFGTYVNLSDTTWLNRSTLGAILTAGDYLITPETAPTPNKMDAFGNIIVAPAESLDEAKIVRQGKRRLRAPIVSTKKKHEMGYKLQNALKRVGKNEKRVKALTWEALSKEDIYISWYDVENNREYVYAALWKANGSPDDVEKAKKHVGDKGIAKAIDSKIKVDVAKKSMRDELIKTFNLKNYQIESLNENNVDVFVIERQTNNGSWKPYISYEDENGADNGLKELARKFPNVKYRKVASKAKVSRTGFVELPSGDEVSLEKY